MNWLIALVIGIAMVLIAYYVAPMPRPLFILLNILGWLLIAIGIILVLALLLHIPLSLGI